MAECHPVGFQWVMEAKARGATVIHVDPRFTRTSALADLHVPIRAGSDIAFLGGLINYVLSTRLYFREYVRRLHQRADDPARGLPGHRGPRRAVLRPRRRARGLRHGHLAVRGHERGAAAASGERDAAAGEHADVSERGARRGARLRRRRRSAGSRTPTRRCSTRAACSRSSSGTSPATPRRWSSRSAACPAELFAAGVPRRSRQLRPRADDGLRLRRRLDPAHRRRAVHPRRGDPPAAARQHRPARRRHPGAARSRQHPGLDRHPDPVRPAARLHPDAARARQRRPRQLRRGRDARDKGFWANMRALHGQPAEGVVGRRGDGGQRLLLRLPAPDHRRPQHLRDGHGPARRHVQGLLPVRARTPPSARPTPRCSASAWPTSTGWSCATSR